MTADGLYGARVTVEATTSNHNVPCLMLTVVRGDGTATVSVDIDENQAAALAKAIESGVMVIQARAVAR